LTEQEEQILDILVFTDFRYFLTATQYANIYVWKYFQSGKVEPNKRLIHTFSGHYKPITSIMEIKAYPHLFLSASVDGTARIWSLETFQHLYTFNLPSGMTFCKVFSGAEMIFCGTPEYVSIQ